MTLKITDSKATDGTLIRIEGRLEAGGVSDLESLCLHAATPIHLDLTALLNVDEVGLGLLRALIASGATVRGVSPYIRYLLEPEAAAPASSFKKP